MTRSAEPLVVGRVVGDVVDMFVPSVELVVSYPIRQVNNGCQINPSAVARPPQIQIEGQGFDDSLFTLIMIDPDAPSPSEPLLREWVHWIVTDIPTGLNSTPGQEILPYDAPKPMLGIHRYVFVLFRQLGGPLVAMAPTKRSNFKTREFAAQHGLGLPVAVVYFNSQKHAGSRRR
eukprot:c15145_g1_i1 orf=87-611(-)